MPQTSSIKIGEIPLTELTPWKDNPKEHDITAIINSIKEVGFVTPLIVDEQTKRIIAGHGRYKALLSLQKDAPAPPPNNITLDENGTWLIPAIIVSGLSEEEMQAYAIADNKLVTLGGWDIELLTEMLSEIEETDLLEVTGFTQYQYTLLLNELSMKGNREEIKKYIICPTCGLTFIPEETENNER